MLTNSVNLKQLLFASAKDPRDGAEPLQELARDRRDISAWDAEREQKLQHLLVAKCRSRRGEPLPQPLAVACG